MPYRYQLSDDDVARGLQRMAREQISRARGALADPSLDEGTRVHEARKRIKKVRGLLRLVRPTLDVYDRERQTLRRAARALARIRDRDAMIETYDRVMDGAAHLARADYAPLRRRLTLARRAAAADEGRAVIALADGLLGEVEGRLRDWRPAKRSWRSLAPGLLKTYGRARDGLKAAGKDPDPETLHDWRKRVKYHRYHTQILREIWPERLAPHVDGASHLGDVLGEHHDMALFRPVVEDAPLREPAKRALQDHISGGMAGREAEALALGRRLFADSPKALGRRWGVWWETWRETA